MENTPTVSLNLNLLHQKGIFILKTFWLGILLLKTKATEKKDCKCPNEEQKLEDICVF